MATYSTMKSKQQSSFNQAGNNIQQAAYYASNGQQVWEGYYQPQPQQMAVPASVQQYYAQQQPAGMRYVYSPEMGTLATQPKQDASYPPQYPPQAPTRTCSMGSDSDATGSVTSSPPDDFGSTVSGPVQKVMTNAPTSPAMQQPYMMAQPQPMTNYANNHHVYQAPTMQQPGGFQAPQQGMMTQQHLMQLGAYHQQQHHQMMMAGHNQRMQGAPAFNQQAYAQQHHMNLLRQNIHPAFIGQRNPGMLPKKKTKKRRGASREEALRARRAPRFHLPEDAAPMSAATLSELETKFGLTPQSLATIPARARFLVMKSFYEDDVHKAVKFNMWSSTPQGNEKLQKLYEEAQEEAKSLSPDGTGVDATGKSFVPVYLLYSVNKSKGFTGIAEMTGPVDFDAKVDFWMPREDGSGRSDRWRGAFPIRWITIKDVPNTQFQDLVFPGTATHRPIIFSRDATEVPYAEAYQFVRRFINFCAPSSLLQDMDFYDREFENDDSSVSGASSIDSSFEAGSDAKMTHESLSTATPPGFEKIAASLRIHAMKKPCGFGRAKLPTSK